MKDLKNGLENLYQENGTDSLWFLLFIYSQNAKKLGFEDILKMAMKMEGAKKKLRKSFE